MEWKQFCPNDERNDVFAIPDYLQHMLDNNMLGSKTKQGFYKKVKGEGGKSKILALDLNTLEYRAQEKTRFETIGAARKEDDLVKRMAILFNGSDQAGDFYKKSFSAMFAYVSHRVPEISDELYKIDDAMRAGFGWELGPFETWDSVGIQSGLEQVKANGLEVADWVNEFLASGHTSFYKVEEGTRKFYDITSKSFQAIPTAEGIISISSLPESSIVWQNKSVIVRDLADGILSVSWNTKMNTIGADVIQGLNKAIDLAEASYKGLVVYNDTTNFSAGADVGMIFMMAVEQEFDELDMAIRTFQNTMMRMRHSAIPVVAAPHSLCLGGGTELCLHADKVVAYAETYMGLVEFGVGVIPGGGGTKEFALRLSDELDNGDIRINQFRERFLTIGQAKVATSAHEAFEIRIST